MRMDPCADCGEHVNIISDHARWCPKRTVQRKNPDGSAPDICGVCGVDHAWGMADLSHGIIRLLLHAQERVKWSAEMGYPINGDMIARQRARILNNSLLFSTTDPEEIDWKAVEAGHGK